MTGTVDREGSQTEIFELSDFDSHGTTRARYRGRWIEVEHGIPGETVRAEILGGKRQRARILDVLKPAPDRVEPPCVYFRDWACGGCQWQHISYEGQVKRKQREIEATMQAYGLPLDVTATHTLDEPWRYRSTAGISLGKSAGFRRRGSLAIVPIRDCLIADPLIGRLMADLNDLLSDGRLPDFRGRVRLDVRLVGIEPGTITLHVMVRRDNGHETDRAALRTLTSALIAMDYVTGVSQLQDDGSVETLCGDLFAPTVIAGRPVWLASASFFQTNRRLLPTLIKRLAAEAAPVAGKRIADLYGGVGVLGLFLAHDAREVTIVESDAIAVAAGRRTAEAWNISNTRFVEGEAVTALTEIERYDVVIVDPSRSGLDDAVLQAIATTRPPLILYVSCLAESLGRDLGTLFAAGYKANSLELLDFYPQTYHVELLTVLRHRKT